MIIKKFKIEGSHIFELDKFQDERGFFARAWDKQKLKNYGINANLVHCNLSFSHKKGTFHGLHYQISPLQEEKLVRCVRGEIYDVMVDLRKKSKTFKKWAGLKMTQENRKSLFVPKGCAHGFVTLKNNTEVFYQNTQKFNSTYERGIRWNDPSFSIKWPIKPKIFSDKDNSWKNFI